MPARRWCGRRLPQPAAMPRSSARRLSVRAAVEVFEPQDAAVAALTKRVKEGFDPKGVLNPGRM